MSPTLPPSHPQNRKLFPNRLAGIASLAKPYWGFIFCLFWVSLFANGLNLVLPKIFARVIDNFSVSGQSPTSLYRIPAIITVVVFLVAIVQAIFQTYLSEKIGRDLRARLIHKISNQPFSYIPEITPEKLLTNLTNDIDNVKQVIALGLVQVFSSIILIVGASYLLISLNSRLAFIVLGIIPIILIIFIFTFRRISRFFKKAQANIDHLNKVINESIIASPLIRILNSQKVELKKFGDINNESRDIGLSILYLFSGLIPTINLIANLGLVAIVFVGGRSIIFGDLTLGGFTAFLSYIAMLIFPIIILGFIGNLLARAFVSVDRILLILNTRSISSLGQVDKDIKGKIDFVNVSLNFGTKTILKNITFSVLPGSRTAIIGPTAAGKTQIFYLMSGLLDNFQGKILIDDLPLSHYTPKSLANQIGLVFQDSSIFNTTIRENINFKNLNNDNLFHKAVQTAQLEDFIESLPAGLDTKIAERGASLSGGQKQRITLARALVLNPKILLLDDFTARVDRETEKQIFAGLKKNYPCVTQVLITQQIASITDFDRIILIMEGEVLAIGTHSELLQSSPEYQQIYSSQQSLST